MKNKLYVSLILGSMLALSQTTQPVSPSLGGRLSDYFWNTLLPTGTQVAATQTMIKTQDKIAQPLASDVTLTDLNRETPKPIKALVDFYRKPEKYRPNPAVVSGFWAHCQQKLNCVKDWAYGVQDQTQPFKGILLHGEPGTGKTELMRALAGEGIPVFALSGSEVHLPHVGESEKMIRDIYSNALKNRWGGGWLSLRAWFNWLRNKPAHACTIVFLDEIDSIAGKRGEFGGKYTDSILNQLLTTMDGSMKYNNIITIASTNRPDLLDNALTRTGRLDIKIKVDNPTVQEKKNILLAQLQKRKLQRTQSFDEILNQESTFKNLSTSDCAHLPNICNTFKCFEDKQEVSSAIFKEAVQSIGKNIGKEIKTPQNTFSSTNAPLYYSAMKHAVSLK